MDYIWARVKNSSNSVYGPGQSLRVHMCAHNPCRVHINALRRSRYTQYGPPVHMQRITCIDQTAAPFVEPSSTTTAVAAYTPTVVAICDDLATHAADDNTGAEIGALNAQQADAARKSVENMKSALNLDGVKGRRRQRIPTSLFTAFDAVKRRRSVEERKFRDSELIHKAETFSQTQALNSAGQAAFAARKTALADLANAKKLQQQVATKLACDAAMKTFSMHMLGGTGSKARGREGHKNRFHVLDRLPHLGDGLHPYQRNDFEWWKRAWDDAMVEEHKGKWAETFASWMQDVLNSKASNAFSTFVYKETSRVLRDKKALVVPGS